MGVKSLWEIVGPSARPVRVEALRNKKLAVDASIWIYQFMKAVRDNEGNQLQNAHIVGFFRRICKLLFLGVKPVFVFDGGVPALKRDTIRKRKEKREENKESIEQIAQRLLAKQLQEYADGKLSGSANSSPKKKTPNKSAVTVTSTATRRERPTNEMYFDTYYDDIVEGGESGDTKDDADLNTKEKQENESKMFKRQDDYDLPNLKGGIKVESTDNRVMTDYEYDRLTKDISDDLDNVDLDKINPQSKEFERLPLSTQYIVLSHLRLRSRLRLGYTKLQLQALFPDPMEFSKFQIKMVQKRNYFTQKIMNVTGMDGDADEDIVSRRIASDRNRAYNLKRVGNGYALTIEKQPETESGSAEKPVFLEDIKVDPKILEIGSDEDEDIDWDDVELKEVKSVEKPAVVENPLFVHDNDEDESDSEDSEDIELEDVTYGDVPSNIEQTQDTVAESKDDDDDEVMKQIKYLYEYSAKNNKKKNAGRNEHIVLSDDDMDEYHEMQIQQVEDDELRKALEESKRDYLKMLDDEKNGVAPREDAANEPPIILNTSTLAKTLKLPNFSMKSNLLFGGNQSKSTGTANATTTATNSFSEKKQNQGSETKDAHFLAMLNNYQEPAKDTKVKKTSVVELSDDFEKDDEINEVKTTEEDKKEKRKPQPLPQWFASGNDIRKNTQNEVITKRPALTEDEKAGLVSYGEVENYFSSDDEDFEISKTNNFNKSNVVDLEAEEVLEKSPIQVEDVDQVDMLPKPERLQASSKKVTFESVSDKSEDAKATDTSKSNISQVLTGNKQHNIDMNQDSDDDFEFSDDEDVNLLLEMENENASYNNFLGSITNSTSNGGNDGKSWTIQDEAALQERLRRQKRDSDEVTTKMIYDVQDLLSRFGIPFITAPMEAEAQCAELKLIGLVDGIITDDSDCFLFGGDRVYKNLFNDKHFVECYQTNDINEELGLDRNLMIDLAILLGSDYTEGIKGVGKVMAMEILGEFKSLKNFKDWWIDYQNGKIDERTETGTKRRIRKKLSKNLFLGSDFPNKLIYEAYLHPEVDHDRTAFQWGQPDVEKLRTFFKFYVGWKADKVDEILMPVLQSMGQPQTSIEEFFSVDSIQRRRRLKMSKRVADATEKLKKAHKNTHKEDSEEYNTVGSKKPKH